MRFLAEALGNSPPDEARLIQRCIEYLFRQGRDDQRLVRRRPKCDEVGEGTSQARGSRATASILQMNSAYFYCEQIQRYIDVFMGISPLDSGGFRILAFLLVPRMLMENHGYKAR